MIVSFASTGPPLYHSNEPMCAFLAQLGILPIPLPLYDPFQEAELPLAKGFYLSERPTPTGQVILGTGTEDKHKTSPIYYSAGFGMKLEASRRNNVWSLANPAWTTMAFSPDLKQGQLPGSDLSLIAAFQASLKDTLEDTEPQQREHAPGRVSVFGSAYLLSEQSLTYD